MLLTSDDSSKKQITVNKTLHRSRRRNRRKRPRKAEENPIGKMPSIFQNNWAYSDEVIASSKSDSEKLVLPNINNVANKPRDADNRSLRNERVTSNGLPSIFYQDPSTKNSTAHSSTSFIAGSFCHHHPGEEVDGFVPGQNSPETV